jgi:hypothetical protein
MAQDERRPFDIIEDFPFMLTLEAFRTSSQHPVELGTLNFERGRGMACRTPTISIAF